MNRLLRTYSAVLLTMAISACNAFGEYTGGREVPHEWPEKSAGGITWSSDQDQQSEATKEDTKPAPARVTNGETESVESDSATPLPAEYTGDPDFAEFEEFKLFKAWQKAKEGPNSAPLADDFELWKEWRAYRQSKQQVQ